MPNDAELSRTGQSANDVTAVIPHITAMTSQPAEW